MSAWPRLHRIGAVLLPMLILVFAGWVLNRQVMSMDWNSLRVAFSHIGAIAILQSVVATAASFLGLALIEVWAVRKQPGLRVSTAAVMVAGAASHALGHVLGWHAVIGMLVRRKAYAAAPAQLLDILLAVGAAVLAGVAASLSIGAAALHSGRSAGLVVCMVVVIAMLGWRSRATNSMPVIQRWTAGQVQRTAGILPIALLEAAAGLAALWVLLPAGTFVNWPAFVVTCVLAQAAGVVSHVPGGLGVFEVAMLASVPEDARPGMLAAILVYRAIYGLLPFATLGVPWLAWSWLRPRPAGVQQKPAQLDRG